MQNIKDYAKGYVEKLTGLTVKTRNAYYRDEWFGDQPCVEVWCDSNFGNLPPELQLDTVLPLTKSKMVGGGLTTSVDYTEKLADAIEKGDHETADWYIRKLGWFSKIFTQQERSFLELNKVYGGHDYNDTNEYVFYSDTERKQIAFVASQREILHLKKFTRSN